MSLSERLLKYAETIITLSQSYPVRFRKDFLRPKTHSSL